MTAVSKRGIGLVVMAGLALLSVGAGRVIVDTEAIHASPREIALAGAGAVAALAVMLVGPVACIAAIAVLTVLRVVPEVSVGGGVDLLAPDPFFVALVCWWIVGVATERSRAAAPRARGALSIGPIALLLGYIGLTLLYVAAVDPGRLSVSFVSWVRLVETAAIGLFAATFLRTRRDVTFVLGAVAIAATVAILVALVGGAGEPNGGPLGTRGGGVVNPNTLGLVSGLLVLTGAFGAVGPSLAVRVPLVLWGAVGVVQSQSVGSIVGTSVALVLGLAFASRRRVIAVSALRALIALGIGVAMAYGVAAAVRPENLPTSQHFRDSSAGQRAVLGAAGLEIAERHPIIGVGWRRSEEPKVIGDPDVNRELRARFPSTRDEFFPDVSPGTVHNAYVQMAADLGLIGIGLLVFVLVTLVRQIRRALARVDRRHPEWPPLWFLTWGLLLIALWWNDNPVFGGQAETVLPAIFLGAFVCLTRSGTARPRDDLLAGAGGDRGHQPRQSAPPREQVAG